MCVVQIIGLGTVVMTPLIGNLSDVYGRKSLLTVPLALSIIPLGTYMSIFFHLLNCLPFLLLVCFFSALRVGIHFSFGPSSIFHIFTIIITPQEKNKEHAWFACLSSLVDM